MGRVLLVVGLVLVCGCAMRVSGVVRDAATGGPIPGAVVAANDGRQRVVVTDPAGAFSLKTDSTSTTVTAAASGYQAKTTMLPSGDRFPTVNFDLAPQAGTARAAAPRPIGTPSTSAP